MRSQIRGLNQASRNAQDGISMIQTAEGALSETQAIGQRMRELAVQSANGTYIDEDRELINHEFGQLKKEIDRIASDTEFNGNKVLNGNVSGKEITTEVTNPKREKEEAGINLGTLFGSVDPEEIKKLGEGNFKINVSVDDEKNVTVEILDKSHFNGNKEYIMDSFTFNTSDEETNETFKIAGIELELTINKEQLNESSASFEFTNVAEKIGNGVDLQVGANKEQMIGFSIENMRSRELGLGGIDVLTSESSQEAIERLDIAVKTVSAQRADLGAAQNRLEHTIASTDNTAENLQAAESRIRDVDMAKEMMNLTKLNVLQGITSDAFSSKSSATTGFTNT